MYIDAENRKYKSHEEYVNSPDLDLDLVYAKLRSGEQASQNKQEREVEKELDKMKSLGMKLELSFEQIAVTNFNELRDKAMRIATKVHKIQVDKRGKSYIRHPLRAKKLCQGNNSEIVALLHDTIEDGDITAKYLLTQGSLTYIIDAVLSVSRNKGEGCFDFIQRSKTNFIGRRARITDLRDNMDIMGLNELTDNDIEGLKKHFRAYKVLEEEWRWL